MESATITLLQTIIKMLSEKINHPDYANVPELARILFGKASQSNKQKVRDVINRQCVPHYMSRVSGGPYYRVKEVEAAIEVTKWDLFQSSPPRGGT